MTKKELEQLVAELQAEKEARNKQPLRRFYNWSKPYIVPFILGMLIGGAAVGFYMQSSSLVPRLSSATLTMSEAEARLTKQAISLVRQDVDDGSIADTDLAIEALSGELPESVRKRVLQALGKPGFRNFCNALEDLEDKIKIR